MTTPTPEENERFLRTMRANGIGLPGNEGTVGLDRAFLLLDEVDALRAHLTQARREAEEARGRALGEAAASLEFDAAAYDASADEAASTQVPAYQVGRAMAAACRTGARSIRALAPVAQEAEDDLLDRIGDAVDALPTTVLSAGGRVLVSRTDVHLALKALASRAPAVKR